MQATKDHISFETAKMLKDCKISSKNSYSFFYGKYSFSDLPYEYKSPTVFDCIRINGVLREDVRQYPAFTWQEILWEYPEEFFGKEFLNITFAPLGTYNYSSKEHLVASNIMRFLQQKKYDEADLYFREHCVLIKK